MQSRIKEIESLDAEVLAISVDSPEESQKLVEHQELSYLLLSDSDRKVIESYGLLHKGGGIGEDIARPATFILDREGNIVWRQLTDNWRVRTRPEPVLEELRKIP